MSRLQKGYISAIDTETINGYAVITANHRRAWECHNFEECVKPLFSDIKKQRAGGRTFFYNISYDAQAILKYLPESNLHEILETNQTIYDNRYAILFIRGKIFKIRDLKYKTTMSGYDLAQFFNYKPLDEVGQRYLDEGKYTDSIITEITTNANLHTNEELEIIFKDNIELLKDYCKQDASLTQRLGVYLSEKIYEMYGFKLSSYASKTGIGKKLTKNHVGYEDYGNNKRVLCYPKFFETSLPARIAKESYHGGIFDAAQRGTFDECTAIDISSAYPYAMVDLPNWSNGGFFRVNQNTLEDSDVYGWVRANFDYSLIPYRSDMINVWQEFHKDQRDMSELMDEHYHQEVVTLNKRKFYPAGGRTQTITLLEYRFLEKHGYLLDKEFKGFVWRANESKKQYPNPFGWISKVYNMKKDIADTTGKDSYKYSLTKIPMNSMYGVTAQKVGHAEFRNDFYASSITAGTRVQIYEMLEENNLYKDMISIATDGILLEGDITIDEKYTQECLGSWDVDSYESATVIANGIYVLQPKEKNGKPQGMKQGLRGMLSFKGDLKKLLEEYRNEQAFIPDTKNRPLTMHQALKWKRYTKEDLNVFTTTGRALNCNVDTTKHWFGIENFGSLLDGKFRGKRFTVEEVDAMSKKLMKNLPDGVSFAENTMENIT